MRTIRNRAFHWENLNKTRRDKNNSGKIYPRITVEEKGSFIGIMPEKILEFLDDLIEAIDNPVIKKYKDMDIKYKDA